MDESTTGDLPLPNTSDGSSRGCIWWVHTALRWLDWYTYVLCTTCLCPSTSTASCDAGKHGVSTGARTALVLSAVLQSALLFAIVSSLYTFSLLGMDAGLHGAALWYEAPSVVSIAFCLHLFARGVQWSEWTVWLYGSLELVKIACDIVVVYMWYASMGRDGQSQVATVADRHTVWLMCLLGASVALSIVNVLVLYSMYKRWCTSQTKVENAQSADLDETCVEAQPDDHAETSAKIRPTKTRHARRQAPPPPQSPPPRAPSRPRYDVLDCDTRPIDLTTMISREEPKQAWHAPPATSRSDEPTPARNKYADDIAYFT
jgi:hypothetical protein